MGRRPSLARRGTRPEFFENAWTESARIVFSERYLRRDDHGRTLESPSDLFWRVATSVASVESAHVRSKWRDRFFGSMLAARFLPNSPTLINAGRVDGQLAACFVLPVPDSLGEIFGTLRDSALIHQSGGGTGFSFSRLRSKGSVVRSTGGVASGPVSFVRIFDTATETVKQGGVRRGANMAVLRVDHPDILEFITSKRDGHSIANFNISVGMTEEFMRALETRRAFSLRRPEDGRVVMQVDAGSIFGAIVDCAWSCGDPGVVFLDRMNRFNPTPARGAFEATNPCGEQPLLPYESCNLGSVNLAKFLDRGSIDWESLGQEVELAVRFLDNVIDINHYPVKESANITLKNRKIGLGVMGLADVLLLMGIPYDSAQARTLGERLMAFVDRRAKRASHELASRRGSFDRFSRSLWAKLGYPALRNATVSTVAPTGSISILAGCSSGIEPIFAAAFERHVLGGKVLSEVHPAVRLALGRRGEQGGLGDEDLERALGRAWSPARRVSVEGHIRMQAAFQRHSDSAVSKTINLPESATMEDVRRAFLLAYQAGCKGITVYRDHSRSSQVLQATRDESCEVCAD